MVEESNFSMDISQGCAGTQLSQTKERRQKHAVQHGRDRSKIAQQKSKVDTHHSKIVEAITARNQNCFMTSKRRDVFNKWRDYARDRRKCVRRLATLMTQALSQRTFNKIRDHQKNEVRQEEFVKTSTRAFKLFHKYWLKRALAKWR